MKPPVSSSYFSEPQFSSTVASPPLTVIPSDQHFIHEESSEDWESELASPKLAANAKLQEKSRTSCEDLGSGDEGERDFNAEIEAFGLSKDDFN